MSVSEQYKEAVKSISLLVNKVAEQSSNREEFLSRLDNKISKLNSKKESLMLTIKASIGLIQKPCAKNIIT